MIIMKDGKLTMEDFNKNIDCEALDPYELSETWRPRFSVSAEENVLYQGVTEHTRQKCGYTSSTGSQLRV